MRTGQVYLTLCLLKPLLTLNLTASTLSGCRLKVWSHASTEASLSCRCHRVLHSPNQRAVLIRVAAVSMKVASAYSRSAFVQSCFPSASSACVWHKIRMAQDLAFSACVYPETSSFFCLHIIQLLLSAPAQTYSSLAAKEG